MVVALKKHLLFVIMRNIKQNSSVFEFLNVKYSYLNVGLEFLCTKIGNIYLE